MGIRVRDGGSREYPALADSGQPEAEAREMEAALHLRRVWRGPDWARNKAGPLGMAWAPDDLDRKIEASPLPLSAGISAPDNPAPRISLSGTGGTRATPSEPESLHSGPGCPRVDR